MFENKFKIQELKIHSSKYWVWSLRENQVTLGSSILSLKRNCMNFSDLSKAEFSDMQSIIVIIERTLKHAFNFDKINYLMLMMVDNYVHFHIFPRYSKPVVFRQKKWQDDDWPKPPKILNKPLNNIYNFDILVHLKNEAYKL